ncbi:hypothetical protein JOS77_29685 [Chromobacterium haemolyticum]|nr:hypothetical protein JOS77_29685 [Chromobacterium haemolyticum]
MNSTPHQVYVLMGVSGCGKSALAAQLSQRLTCAVLDGDFPASSRQYRQNGRRNAAG